MEGSHGSVGGDAVTPLAVFAAGFAFGWALLLLGLSYACWNVFRPLPVTMGRNTVLLTEHGKEALIRAIQADLQSARNQ